LIVANNESFAPAIEDDSIEGVARALQYLHSYLCVDGCVLEDSSHHLYLNPIV